jgi:dephospho-CoA kinase
MFKVAITGGAGSGKSTVARMFQDLGAQVLDADEVAREVVRPGTPAGEELRQAFGPQYFRENGELDRAALARRVFADPGARRRLNHIIHPRVAREMRRRLQESEAQGAPLVLVEVPLLFEAGLAGAYDRIIVVDVDEADQMQRLRDRDGRSPQEIAGILQAQMPLPEKASRAHYLVDNRGTLNNTLEQVKIIWGELQKIILTAAAKKGSVPN